MARVTVEDCIIKIPNRFDLVTLAAQRARDISSGSPLTIERDNDKNPVVALREIADDKISLDALQKALISGLQRHVEKDEPEEDELDAFAIDGDMVFDQEGAQEDLADESEEIEEDVLSVQDENALFPEEDL